jgi:putative restriction endonuclease
LRPGEPFFFKTHAPHNRVVGGGFFGGAVSMGQMLDRIAHYRREPRAPGEDPVIGCIFIRDVTFFPDDLTFDPPPGFSSNVVQGKTYDMGDERYSRYLGDLMQMVLGVAVELDLTQPWHRSGPVFGDPRLAPNRLGQQAFKAVVGGRLVLAVRDHRRQDPPRPRGRPHPAGVTPIWWGKPARQRTAAQVGRAPHV